VWQQYVRYYNCWNLRVHLRVLSFPRKYAGDFE
jgi:hypothetical protein